MVLKLGRLFAARKARDRAPAPALLRVPLDLSDPAFVQDPYPSYAWLRTHCPVAEVQGGGFLLSRHADIKAAFTDKRLSNAPSRFSTLAPRNAGKYVAADLASRIPPFQDGDAHRLSRQMISRAFYNAFAGFDRMLEELAQKHVHHLSPQSDLIADGAMPFALGSMCRFCGITASTEDMKPLTQAFFHLFAPLRDAQAFESVNDALGTFRQVIAASLDRGPPQGSLLAELHIFAEGQAGLDRADVVDACLLVFADGVENVEAAVASAFLVFAQADLLPGLRSGAVDLDAAIAEAMRLQTPAQFIPRVAAESFDIHGVQIGKDMPVFLALASGNRDADVFDTPDSFDAGRDLSDVLTFGQGRHRCIGEPLAKAQVAALLKAVLAAGFRADLTQPVGYHSRIGHRWPTSVILTT
ncbi:MAG: cytochrome P450 [Pseudomonadota bacterium]